MWKRATGPPIAADAGESPASTQLQLRPPGCLETRQSSSIARGCGAAASFLPRPSAAARSASSTAEFTSPNAISICEKRNSKWGSFTDQALLEAGGGAAGDAIDAGPALLAGWRVASATTNPATSLRVRVAMPLTSPPAGPSLLLYARALRQVPVFVTVIDAGGANGSPRILLLAGRGSEKLKAKKEKAKELHFFVFFAS